MKIGVLHVCQNEGIAVGLRALLPDAEIINYHTASDLTPEVQTVRADLLNSCDHVIITTLPDRYGKLSQRSLEKTAKNVHVVPCFNFAGFHPDMCYVVMEGEALPSPAGHYHSRIAIAGYLGAIPPEETAALFNRLVFSRLGYLQSYAEQSALFIEDWAKFGVDAAPLLEKWRSSGCFCTTINHPKMNVLLDVARIACDRMRIVPQREDIDAATLPDLLGNGPMFPVFPDIAAAAGVPAEGSFSSGVDRFGVRQVLTPVEFVRRCFDLYADVPPEVLLTAAGVAQTMSALDLTHKPRFSTRREFGAAMLLMTPQGTILRSSPVTGKITHLPLTVPASEAPFLFADCTAPSPAKTAPNKTAPGKTAPAQTAPALAGAELRHAARPNCVTLSRGGAFLHADLHTRGATFRRDAAHGQKVFLPLSTDDVSVLNEIRQADWRVSETGETVARHFIRLVKGPRLQFGHWSVDLTHDFPERIADDVHRAFVLRLDGELCTIREAPSDSLNPVAEGAATIPGPAGVVPEPLGRRVLAGEPVWLAPPVTVCAADRDWLYRTAIDPSLLDGRAKAADAILLRARDRLIGGAGPGLPGLSIQFCQADGLAPLAWVDAAIRLHILAPIAPAEARFLLPPGTDAYAQAWDDLGFADTPYTRLRTNSGVAEDLLWLDNATTASLPAEALRGFRARIGGARARGKKLYWAHGLSPVLPDSLSNSGFEVFDPAENTARAQVEALAQATIVVGRSGRIPLAFCHDGKRVIELSNDQAFTPDDWLMSAKLGLMHAVLPCAETDGLLSPDDGKLALLLTLVSLRQIGAPTHMQDSGI